MKVAELLSDRAEHFANKPAIIFKERSVSFSGLKDSVVHLAGAFSAKGITKGTRVAVYLPNCPEYIYSYLALYYVGAVVVPLDFMLTEEEIKHFVWHSESSVLIAHVKKGVDFFRVKESCPSLKSIVGVSLQGAPVEGADESWPRLKEAQSDFAPPDFAEDEPSSIFYTSGSTGHPKGVVLTYAHLDNPVRCIDHFLKPTSEDSYLCAGVPFSHIGGLDYLLFMLHFGSTLVLMDRFQPLEALKNLEQYKITIFCIVPAMFIAILSVKECEKYNLTYLRYPVVFGAPSSPALLKRFHRLCPNGILLNGWGMTETAAPNTFSPPDINKINSIGRFGVGMEAKAVNEEGRDVPAGERGELLVKGEAVMRGYYKEAELTRSVMTDDGWFRTGDVVVQDSEGLFYIVGRKKDMLKVGGEIAFTSEIEESLHRHPAVQEVAVIGVPDHLRGEVPHAFIVVKEGQTLAAEEVRDFARKRLAHFKVPHKFHFVPHLPKNRTGKVDRENLKKGNVSCPE